MIKNEVQYRVTKAQVERFEKALVELRTRSPARLAKGTKLRSAYEASIKSQLEELAEQLAEYDTLRGSRSPRLELKSLDDLPKVLVQARIAAGFSQREFAERLSMKEQQIQRYEATEYASASLTRLREIALALGLKLKEAAVFEQARKKPRTQAHRIGSAGRTAAGKQRIRAKTSIATRKAAAKPQRPARKRK